MYAEKDNGNGMLKKAERPAVGNMKAAPANSANLREAIINLYEWLDGTEYVQMVEFGEVLGIITWDGGHGLHFYNVECEEVETKSFGDFSKDRETLEHALSAIYDWVDEIKEELEAE